MKIAYNPKTAAALISAPANNDITFDLSGLSIYVKGVRFKGTDTIYSVFKKHNENGGGYDGLVPVPDYNSGSATRYLREDGTWQYVAATDQNVLQSETTSTKFIPVVLGLTQDTSASNLAKSVIGQVYVTTKMYAQPSTGYLYASKLFSGGKEVLVEHQSLSNYVTLNTAQTITGTKTFGSNIQFNGTQSIHWNNGTYQQRIAITYDSTVNTSVFNFQQSTNNGSSWNNILQIYDNGILYSNGYYKNGSSDSYVLLGGGGHKLVSDFMLKTEELSNNLTTITKSLNVTQAWMDTGITSTNLPANGTYIVQVQVSANDDTGQMYNCYSSGVMSWYKDATNDTETDEIILHRSGRAYGKTIYLRTVMQSSGVLKLQIGASSSIGKDYTYTFKFKRII